MADYPTRDTAVKRRPGRPLRILPSQHDEIVALIAGGLSLVDVARRIGVARGSLYNHAARDPLLAERIAEAKTQGQATLPRKPRRRAEARGETARGPIWAAGQDVTAERGRGQPPKILPSQYDQIVELIAEGVSLTAIARRLNVSRTTLYNHAARDPHLAERVAHAPWRRFCRQVEALGGAVLESTWLGSGRAHRIRCDQGHQSTARPSEILKGKSLCLTCVSGKSSPADAELSFRRRVNELGGVILEPKWLGTNKRHQIRCSQGHETTTRPSSVHEGLGICRFCAGRKWDAFYVVIDDDLDRLKFGITSGSPRRRLADHASDGFTRVLRTLTDLPGNVARELENDVIATLRLAKEEPIKGREYFHSRVTATVLDIVDNYPIDAVSEAA